MGSSSSVGELIGKLEKAAQALEKSRTTALKAGSAEAKKQIEAARNVVAPSGRLRNAGKNGAALSVRSAIAGDTATVSASGPWPLIESDTPRHVIGAASRNVKRQGPVLPGARKLGGVRQRGGGVRLPNGGIRRSVVHPGTKGKHPFRKGVAAALEPATEAMSKTVVEAVFQSFG